jgi:alkylation response protein AidB-like acyl-CoA dehydrogenase
MPRVQQAENRNLSVERKWGDLGLFGIRYPEADGGSEWTRSPLHRAREIRSGAKFRDRLVRTVIALWPIWRVGTQAQMLPQAGTRGPSIGAFALGERSSNIQS